MLTSTTQRLDTQIVRLGKLLLLASLLAGHQVGKANSIRTSRLKEVIVPTYRTEMVNTDIPRHYTASPSSYGGTPHLTINHDVAADLDSNNAFEGKLCTTRTYFTFACNTKVNNAKTLQRSGKAP